MVENIRTLYHWTHICNIASIKDAGLDPSYATGEMYAVWGCRLGKTDWAQKHVAARHKWPCGEMVLLRINTYQIPLYATRWSGVFYTPCDVPPDQIQVLRADGRWEPLSMFLSPKNTGTPSGS